MSDGQMLLPGRVDGSLSRGVAWCMLVLLAGLSAPANPVPVLDISVHKRPPTGPVALVDGNAETRWSKVDQRASFYLPRTEGAQLSLGVCAPTSVRVRWFPRLFEDPTSWQEASGDTKVVLASSIEVVEMLQVEMTGVSGCLETLSIDGNVLDILVDDCLHSPSSGAYLGETDRSECGWSRPTEFGEDARFKGRCTITESSIQLRGEDRVPDGSCTMDPVCGNDARPDCDMRFVDRTLAAPSIGRMRLVEGDLYGPCVRRTPSP